MFAFIDESGSTGPNLFDQEQPIFYSVAVISKADLDIEYRETFHRLARANGFSSLHANIAGQRGLDPILPEIQRLLKKDNIRFFIAKISKRDLVLTKLADTIFDCGENPAVGWHIYNVRVLRLLNVTKLSAIADEPCLRGFWEALQENNPARSRETFKCSLERLLSRLSILPDKRSREVIGSAVDWALNHPDAITVHVPKSLRLSHLPHLVAFPPLLHAIQRQSEYWKSPVKEIRHDRESLVMNALQRTHEMLSHAPVKSFDWVDMTYPVGAVPNSSFKEVASNESPGVQLADIVLWLIRRETEGEGLSRTSEEFLNRVRRNGEPYELSLDAMKSMLAPAMEALMSQNLTLEQKLGAEDMLRSIELRRQEEIPAPLSVSLCNLCVKSSCRQKPAARNSNQLTFKADKVYFSRHCAKASFRSGDSRTATNFPAEKEQDRRTTYTRDRAALTDL
jgi:hypothetical protein